MAGNQIKHTGRCRTDTATAQQPEPDAMYKTPAANDPHTYGGRLQIAIEHANVTVRELAGHLNVSPQSVYKVLRGESKMLQVVNHLKAARFLGVQPRWLSDGAGTMLQANVISLDNNPDYPAIRQIKMTFSAGITGYEVQQIDESESVQPLVFRADWFKSRGYTPGKLVAVKVAGQSMEPTLYDQDLVVLNLEETSPRDGEVYACRYEDELVVKRLFREGGAWWLHSDNADQRRFPRRECGETVEIIGRVVYRQSERV